MFAEMLKEGTDPISFLMKRRSVRVTAGRIPEAP
jgi:hypothetical protein